MGAKNGEETPRRDALGGRARLPVLVFALSLLVAGFGIPFLSSEGTDDRGPMSSDHAAWFELVSNPPSRPIRVVVVSDSIGGTSSGFEETWTSLHHTITDGAPGLWWPPGRPMWPWAVLPGEPVPAGLDMMGVALGADDGPAGPGRPVAIPSTLDVHYTARPDGAVLDVRVDSELVGSVDTSLDQRGQPVSEVVPAQRWRSPMIDSPGSEWSVEVASGGTAVVEAVSTPPWRGIEVHGIGLAGTSTRELLDSGAAMAHIESMVARGEGPDLVVWAADTDDAADGMLDAIEEAFERTRAAAPGASIAHYLPPGHHDRADWPALVAEMRELDARSGVIVLDGAEILGDVSDGRTASDLASDGVHLTPRGFRQLRYGWLEVLDPSSWYGEAPAA